MFLFKHFFTRATDNVVVYLLWIREMLLNVLAGKVFFPARFAHLHCRLLITFFNILWTKRVILQQILKRSIESKTIIVSF